MRVAALQYDVRPGRAAENLSAVGNGLQEAARRGVELVCLPEMWATSFPRRGDDLPQLLAENDRARAQLQEWSRDLGIAVAGSALADGGELPHNRLTLYSAGVEQMAYDKTHLFSPTAEDSSFRPGKQPPATAEVGGAAVTGVICYDLRFAPVLAAAMDGGAQVLLCPAQWPSPRATHWRALALGRAVESQCFVLGCNRTGVDQIGRRGLTLEFPGNSLIVDPSGVVLAEGAGEAGLVVADLEIDASRRQRTRVPVAKDRRPELYRDWPPDVGGEGNRDA